MCYTAKIPDLSTPEKRDEWFKSELEWHMRELVTIPDSIKTADEFVEWVSSKRPNNDE